LRLVPLLALTVATFALGFGELMLAGILPNIARDLHVALPAAGQLVGAYALTFALVSPPLAIALQRVERRTALVAALLVVVAANAGAAAGPDFAVVLVMRIVAAVGSAAATTLALAAVDSVSSDAARGRAHGIVFAGFSAAATLGVPLGVLIAARWSWRDAFDAVALCALVAAVLVPLVIPAAPRGTPFGARDLMRVLGKRPLQLTIAVSLLNLTAQYLVYTYIRPYVDATGGFDATTVAWLLLLFGAAGTVGNIAGGALVDRYGSHGTIVGCLAGTIAVYLVFGVAMRSVLGAALVMTAWALVSWGFAPAVNQRLAGDAEAPPEIGLAFNLTAFNVGIALGSGAGGVVIAAAGPRALPLAAIVPLLIALACAWANPPARASEPELR
jgi:DHA1 family inner membrane transport protein